MKRQVFCRRIEQLQEIALGLLAYLFRRLESFAIFPVVSREHLLLLIASRPIAFRAFLSAYPVSISMWFQ
jgi:hypothetical protein